MSGVYPGFSASALVKRRATYAHTRINALTESTGRRVRRFPGNTSAVMIEGRVPHPPDRHRDTEVRSSVMWRLIGLLFVVGAILVLQTPIQAQTDTHLPVSMERIRAALKEQPLLRVPALSGDVPTFYVEVRERLPVLQPVDEKPFDPTFGLPSVGELMMGGLEKIRSAVVNYKRGRAERRARQEVEDALVAFCAARGCPTSTVNR